MVATPQRSSKGQINIRMDTRQRVLIDRAAASVGKSRTEFVLDATRREAENVLRDRTIFLLEGTDYDDFAALLDAAPEPSHALRDLLKTPSPWE